MPKTESIESMFDHIAPEYDALNHILSLDKDKNWRKTAVKTLLDRKGPHSAGQVLDVACGTGDFSIAVARYYSDVTVKGVDLSEGMLEKGRGKIASMHLSDRISLEKGDCRSLPFPDDSFDGVCVAFGVRNFEFLQESIKEMLRVLKPGRKLVILELSMPSNRFVRNLYSFYFTRILPLVGKSISGDKSAYRYLPESVIRFPAPGKFLEILKECGAATVTHKSLTFGICRLFTALKR